MWCFGQGFITFRKRSRVVEVADRSQGGNQGPEVHIVSNYDSLPDGHDIMGSHARDLVISPEIVKQVVEVKYQSFNIDENNIIDDKILDAKAFQFGDNEGIVGSLVVYSDAGPRRDGNWNWHGETSKKNIYSLDESHHEEVDIQGTMDNFGFETLECLEESTAYDGALVISDVGLETEWRWWFTPSNNYRRGYKEDQETTVEVMAHVVSFKMEIEAEFDPTRWLDKSLIQLCSLFGHYQKGNPSSFSLSPRFSVFPQFINHVFSLSRFFNSSLDETTYFRMILNWKMWPT